jgi:hypothetical protein
MCGQWATNLNGDFNTEFTEDTEKTRKKGEQGIIAEGSRDTENAEKKKQIPSDKVGTIGRFGRNDSTMVWNDGILMITAPGARRRALGAGG